MAFIEFVENVREENPSVIQFQVIDGYHKNLLRENMLSKMKAESVDRIFSNGYKALQYFAQPMGEEQNISKVLCLGKVQSGKTAFFITTIALAFDNGYDVVYLLGGTKNLLKSQNLERVSKEFCNNPKIKVLDLNEIDKHVVQDEINKGFKLIIVCLKNAATNTNLGLLNNITQHNNNIVSLVIDDEGDEYTPGAPKLKTKKPLAGITHDVISNIINNFNCCTFLSVTATPQANLLLSTVDDISPNYIVLVEPGKGYTGGNEYHDTEDNVHSVAISDSDDFAASIPQTFKDCFSFYIVACCIQRVKGQFEPYSMLVHPSSLTRIHAMIREKILDYFDDVKDTLFNPLSLAYLEMVNLLKDQFDIYISNNETTISFDDVLKELPEVLNNIYPLEVNSTTSDDQDDYLYKIYIGGNMLGRGLTIKNLIVTYIYRDAKESAIDTLYQRARWFGYKSDYFDVCRVYMTKSLLNKFRATVDSENDMWNTIEAFLLTNTNVKKMPRLFKLDNDKLILTRKTVSKTISVERINPGYTYDKSVYYIDNQKQKNRELFENFFKEYRLSGTEKSFDISGYQTHYVMKLKYSDFYRDFLSAYHFPKGSDFGHIGFEKILKENVYTGKQEDIVYVVIMRYKSKQYRALNDKYRIKELPQSYNNGTKYDGDKSLPELSDKFHFQIHLVYNDENNKDDYIPMIAFNNPYTKYTMRYVTGDNDYETT